MKGRIAVKRHLRWMGKLGMAAGIVNGAVSGSGEILLVQDGDPRATIYLSGPVAESVPPAASRLAPTAPQIRAEIVEELNYHLEKMSGVRLPVRLTEDPADIKPPAIVMGDLAVRMGAEPRRRVESKEGFRILAKEGIVRIGGESEEAVLFGVYEVLEQLGCEWIMPGEIGIVTPVKRTVSVVEQDRSSAPDFLFRRLWYRGYPPPRLPEEGERMARWLRRQRSGQWTSFANAAAGHVWDAFIRRHRAEFEADPTMLALRRGPDGILKRMGPQLETTHPRVIELFAEEIRETYRKKIAAGEWTAETPAAFPVGPADGLGYSMSAEALAAGSGLMDPIVGEPDRTDELILFCNRILEKVHPDYPNAHVGFYSYSTHAGYPVRYRPNPKIIQIFAPINFSRFHSVLDPFSKSQAWYRRVVEQWGVLSREQGNILIYRGYNWNLAENMLPYSKIRIWGEELPFYKRQGIIGLNIEATKAWSVNGVSDFIFMKLAWDTSKDWRKVLRYYCEKAFGGGADAMESYYLRLTDTQHAAGQEAGSYHGYPLLYDREWVSRALELMARALQQAQGEEERTRIRFVKGNVETLQLFLEYEEAVRRLDFPAAKAAYDAMHSHWRTQYERNTDLVSNEVPQYLKRFKEAFVLEGLRYTSDPYRLAVAIPDELPTFFDPYEAGEFLNLAAPTIPERRWIRTRTYSSTWDAQGLGGLRNGAVWYRFRFQRPVVGVGEGLGLFIGGVEDEARVWLNGKEIGSSGRGFSRPFVFDLTDGLEEGENLLAIQVVRNSKANEIGLGGIIRPSFLFAGPRLLQKAPQRVREERILFGGETAGEP